MTPPDSGRTIRAVYRDGLLIPDEPLRLAEGTPVRFAMASTAAGRVEETAPTPPSDRDIDLDQVARAARPALGLLAATVLLGALVAWLRGADPSGFAPLWQVALALRSLASEHLDLLGVGLPLLAAAGAAGLLLARRRRAIPAALIVLALGTAYGGEALALRQRMGASAWMLIVAGVLVGLASWIGGDRLAAAFEPTAMPWRREAFLLALVLVGFLFTHFLAIGRHPYGVEGDESSWVRKVVEARATDDPERYHFHLIPVTYWLQNESNDLLGTDIAQVRLSVALLGLVATLFFYAATRAMANAPVALLATALMAFSIVDVAAGRQAHPEAYAKIFGVLGAAGVLMGYARRERWWFALAGTALGLGMWTYDSFALAPIGIVGYVLFRSASEPRSWRFHLASLACLTAPLAAMAFRVKPYLDGRRDAQISVLESAIGASPSTLDDWLGAAPELGRFVVEQAAVAYERLTHQGLKDVLIDRTGPLESAIYVPLVALGAVVALCFIRRRQLAFPLFWVVLPAIPTILVLGQTFARTLLPYWGGFLMLGALTLWLTHRALVDALGSRAAKWVGGALVTFIAATGLADSYVAFHELVDPLERQLRRELGERLRRYAAPDNMVVLPFAAKSEDYLDLERWYTRYAISDRATWGEEDAFYRQVPIERLFDEVRSAFDDRARVTVLYDRSIQAPGARAEVLDAFRRCLPEHTVDRGRWIDAYVVSREQYARRACDLGARIELVAPGATEPAGPELDFVWRLDGSEQTDYEVELEQRDDRVLWVEAEELGSLDGWETEGHLAPGFSGSAYLADERAEWRPLVTAKHSVSAPAGGAYTAWARVYRRRDDGGPIRLEIGGRALELGVVAAEQFDRWLWQPLGEVSLEPGDNPLTLTRSYPGVEAGVVFQIFIDALVFTRAPGFDPNHETAWRPLLDTGHVHASESRHRHLAGLPAGTYRWRVRVENGQRLVDWKGTPEATSEFAEFAVER